MDNPKRPRLSAPEDADIFEDEHGVSSPPKITTTPPCEPQSLSSSQQSNCSDSSLFGASNGLSVNVDGAQNGTSDQLSYMMQSPYPLHTLKISDYRVFNDPVHGTMPIPELCIPIIDTPQFQRLRRISQCGTSSLIYPGAGHKRFEHSLGVCFLAGELAKAVQRVVEEKGSVSLCAKIEKKDILCVQIAGLCHDLGHGPYSHLFDGWFMPVAKPDTKWKHEKASRDMLDYLFKENPHVKLALQSVAMLTEQDFVFIKEMIYGPLDDNPETPTATNWPYHGRSAEYSFLYEIVSNKVTGIDVDKFEYLARDAHNFGLKTLFDHHRYMLMIDVLKIPHDGLAHICIREKEAQNIYELFMQRARMHMHAYQHKTIVGTSLMIRDVMLAADKHLKFLGSDGKGYTLSRSIDDMCAYMKTDDSVMAYIQNYLEPPPDDEEAIEALTKAKDILVRLERRQLYTFLGESKHKPNEKYSKGANLKIADELINIAGDGSFTTDDFVPVVIHVDFGMKTEDPVNYMHFYKKNNKKPYQIRRNEVSRILPANQCECIYRVYARTQNVEKQKHIHNAFKEWCAINNLPKPKRELDIFTPHKEEIVAEPKLTTPEK